MTSFIKAPQAPRWDFSALKKAIAGSVAVSLLIFVPDSSAIPTNADSSLTDSPLSPMVRATQATPADDFTNALGVSLPVLASPSPEATRRSLLHPAEAAAVAKLAPVVQVASAANGGVLVARSDRTHHLGRHAIGRVAVAAGNPAAGRLRAQGLHVVEIRAADTLKLLGLVNDRQVEYAVVDAAHLSVRAPRFPMLVSVLRLDSANGIGVGVNTSHDPLLARALHSRQTTVPDAADGADDEDSANLRAFRTAVRDELPHYRTLFERSARASGLDWRLLAAIAYQESKWQPKALSGDGVAGMMMLTRSTAAHLQVGNRRNAVQSINGGARYVQEIFDGLPDSIQQPDRTWMALAAYNMGPGLLERVRQGTADHGYNPDSWHDVSLHLAARGDSSASARRVLNYVERVREYYDTLLLTDTQDDRVAYVTPSESK